MDAFAGWSLERGFSLDTARSHIASLQRLVPWFRRRGKRSVDIFCAEDIAEARRYYRLRNANWAAGVQKLGEFLRSQGILKPGCPRPATPSEQAVSCFTKYLQSERGLAVKTIEGHQNYLCQFLRFLGLDRRRTALKDLRLADIHRFLGRMSSRNRREVMAHVVATIRTFLRFQFTRGTLARPLHAQIDTVRMYQGERLPQPLPWTDFRKVLRKMNRSTPLGLRDFTMLLLAATYGLRRSEVAALELDDIQWQTHTVRIPQVKTRQSLWLPLTEEMGAALADYLQQRAQFPYRQVFLRLRPPIEPLGPMGVGEVLERASRLTDVKLPTTRFHSLRHAVALRFLRQGAPLKSISDVLGHRDPNSTADYLRLDVDDLRSIALPRPRASTRHEGRSVSPPGPGYSPSPSTSPQVTAPAAQGWQSFLARSFKNYLAVQRSLGRGYQREEWILRGLDYFLTRRYPHARIFTAAQFAAWTAELRRLSPIGVRARLLCVRKFCQHQAKTQAGAFVPDLRSFPKVLSAKAPCLLSSVEMAKLLEGTRTINPNRKNPLRPQTMRLVLLLMFCCGLRRGEVLRLCLADIDLSQEVLRINQTKFHKSRLAPLSPSVAKELKAYLRQRKRLGMPMEPQAPLLWNGRCDRTGGALSQTAITANWFRICHCAQVFDHRGRPPRIHDLRHSFAVEALRRGYAAGRDAQATLPRLARYMGHVTPAFTHYYLKFTEPIRQAASDRFRRTLAPSLMAPAPSKPRKGGVV